MKLKISKHDMKNRNPISSVSIGHSPDDQEKQEENVKFYADSACSFTLESNSASAKFHLSNNQIDSVCPIFGDLDGENSLKAIASILQIPTNSYGEELKTDGTDKNDFDGMVMDAVGLCNVVYHRRRDTMMREKVRFETTGGAEIGGSISPNLPISPKNQRNLTVFS